MVLSTAKTQLSRFEKIAPDKKFELGELKSNGRYIHILRDGKIIGCFARDKNGTIIFEHHNSYPEGRKRVPVSELTDNNIKDIIHRTRGRKPRT